MIAREQTVFDLIKKGRLSLADVRHLFSDSSSDAVSVENWNADYITDTGELSEYCAVSQNSTGGAIVAVGLLAYSSDGETMYCAQYTAGFNGSAVMPSVSTALFSPNSVSTILGVLFGSTATGATYFFERSLTLNKVKSQAS